MHQRDGISVQELKTGGHWFDLRLDQYFSPGLMIIIAVGFIPLSLLAIVSTMVTWENSQWLGNNIVQSTGYKNFRKEWIGVLAAVK